MLDVSVAYNRYKFLGYEFLTWLWFVIDTDPEQLEGLGPNLKAVDIGNRIVLSNFLSDSVEIVTIKGENANLEEGMLALRKGAVVTELHLILKMDGRTWELTVKGESFGLTNVKPPQTDAGAVDSEQEKEALVCDRIDLYDTALQLLDNLFNRFIRLRLSDEWEGTLRSMNGKWIYSSSP